MAPKRLGAIIKWNSTCEWMCPPRWVTLLRTNWKHSRLPPREVHTSLLLDLSIPFPTCFFFLKSVSSWGWTFQTMSGRSGGSSCKRRSFFHWGWSHWSRRSLGSVSSSNHFWLRFLPDYWVSHLMLDKEGANSKFAVVTEFTALGTWIFYF